MVKSTINRENFEIDADIIANSGDAEFSMNVNNTEVPRTEITIPEGYKLIIRCRTILIPATTEELE